jgi:hypothetical protein
VVLTVLAMSERWPSLTLSKRPIELLMRSLLEGNAELDGKIEESAVVHPDFFIFESLAGAGAVLARACRLPLARNGIVMAVPTKCRLTAGSHR